MLTGEYYHTIDVKGRIIFPSKLREELGERFFITRWLDDCLVVFSEQEWEKVCEKLKNQSLSKARDIQRFLFSNACCAEPDKQGRILIPENLRIRSGLDKEIAIIGVMDRAEIWDKEKWIKRSGEIDSAVFDSQMEGLDL